MRVLSNKEQIDLLKRVKSSYEKHQGLCQTIRSVSNDVFNNYIESCSYVKDVIPLFTYENAIIACREKHVTIPDGNPAWYWWSIDNKISRFAFVNWLIEQLEKNPGETYQIKLK